MLLLLEREVARKFTFLLLLGIRLVASIWKQVLEKPTGPPPPTNYLISRCCRGYRWPTNKLQLSHSQSAILWRDCSIASSPLPKLSDLSDCFLGKYSGCNNHCEKKKRKEKEKASYRVKVFAIYASDKLLVSRIKNSYHPIIIKRPTQ